MRLFDMFRRGRHDSSVHEQARQLVVQTSECVLRLLAGRAGTLHSLPEARGYIRSRVSRTLRESLPRTFNRPELAGAEVPELILERALEIVIEDCARNMVRPPEVPVASRRAA